MVRRLVVLVALAACGDDGGTSTPDASIGGPSAAQLRALLASCNVVGGPYAADSGGTANISICSLTGAVGWTADLDVDCDGVMTTQCNLTTDPAYQNQTAATDSTGSPLDAAALPYVVLPGKSTRWDYHTAGLQMGSLFAVVYRDTVQYGVAGDIGPTSIIGEASYRMAELLTIDPDPSTGGTADAVIYIGFSNVVVDPIEDHDAAVSLGLEHARALVQ